MRVTDGMLQTNIVRVLGDLTSRQAEASNRALTGQRVNKPSDDPAAAAEIARIRASQAQADAGLKTTSSAKSDLELSESALAQAADLMSNAHALAIQGVNGTLDATGRAALANQVGDLKNQLIALANTKGQNGYLFAGTKTNALPFDANGVFSGNDADHLVDLGTGQPTVVNASGARAFTAAGGRDVFADLDALQAALNANDASAVGATLDNLETSRQQIVTVQADAGVRMDRMNTTEDILTQAKFALATREQNVAGADPYQAYSDLVNLGNSLQNAVGVAKKVLDLGGLVQV